MCVRVIHSGACSPTPGRPGAWAAGPAPPSGGSVRAAGLPAPSRVASSAKHLHVFFARLLSGKGFKPFKKQTKAICIVCILPANDAISVQKKNRRRAGQRGQKQLDDGVKTRCPRHRARRLVFSRWRSRRRRPGCTRCRSRLPASWKEYIHPRTEVIGGEIAGRRAARTGPPHGGAGRAADAFGGPKVGRHAPKRTLTKMKLLS